MFDCIYNVFDSPLWGPGAAVRLKLTRLLMHDLPHPGFLFFPLIHFSWALPMGGGRFLVPRFVHFYTWWRELKTYLHHTFLSGVGLSLPVSCAWCHRVCRTNVYSQSFNSCDSFQSQQYARVQSGPHSYSKLIYTRGAQKMHHSEVIVIVLLLWGSLGISQKSFSYILFFIVGEDGWLRYPRPKLPDP